MKKIITAVIAILLLWSAPGLAKYVMDGPQDGVQFYVTKHGFQFRALADGSITVGKTGSYVIASFPMYFDQYRLDCKKQNEFLSMLQKYIEWHDINMEKKLNFVKTIGNVGQVEFVYLNNYGKNELKIVIHGLANEVDEWLDHKTVKQICVALNKDNVMRHVSKARHEEQKRRDAEHAKSKMQKEVDTIFK